MIESNFSQVWLWGTNPWVWREVGLVAGFLTGWPRWPGDPNLKLPKVAHREVFESFKPCLWIHVCIGLALSFSKKKQNQNHSRCVDKSGDILIFTSKEKYLLSIGFVFQTYVILEWTWIQTLNSQPNFENFTFRPQNNINIDMFWATWKTCFFFLCVCWCLKLTPFPPEKWAKKK